MKIVTYSLNGPIVATLDISTSMAVFRISFFQNVDEPKTCFLASVHVLCFCTYIGELLPVAALTLDIIANLHYITIMSVWNNN